VSTIRRACPSCGAPVPAGARFCPACTAFVPGEMPRPPFFSPRVLLVVVPLALFVLVIMPLVMFYAPGGTPGHTDRDQSLSEAIGPWGLIAVACASLVAGVLAYRATRRQLVLYIAAVGVVLHILVELWLGT